MVAELVLRTQAKAGPRRSAIASKDATKARDYYELSCNLGYAQGCDAAKKVKGSSLFHWKK